MGNIDRCMEMFCNVSYYSKRGENFVNIRVVEKNSCSVVKLLFSYDSHKKTMRVDSYYIHLYDALSSDVEITNDIINWGWIGYCEFRFDATTKKTPEPLKGFYTWSLENRHYAKERA